MSDLSFSRLFKTTLRGVPNPKSIPKYIKMSRSFYFSSVIIQSIILLIFMAFFTLSIFRTIKKIKNQKFKDVRDPSEIERKKQKQNKKSDSNENKQKESFIYQFDEDEEVEEKGNNKVMDVNAVSQEEIFNKYHDKYELDFIRLDKKLLFFMPFLTSFIICNNSFASDFLTPSLLSLTILSYAIFNIKEKLYHIRPLQFVFIGLSLLANFSFFYNDHNVTT